MPSIGDVFKARFGAPSPSAPNGIHFSNRGMSFSWETTSEEVGAGWYRDRFLYLFGDEVGKLAPCLAAWDFLVGKPAGERIILGRNAYGAIAFIDGGDKSSGAVVKIVDPLTVTVWQEADCDIIRFIGGALPQNRTGRFLDDSVYKQHLAATSLYLELDLVLGINTPLGLGGKMALDNFHVENLLKYYEGTAPIYKKALAEGGSSKKTAPAPKAKATVEKRKAAVKTVAKTKKPSPKKR